MSTLEQILNARLTNLRVAPNGWQAQCPICALQGSDLHGKNHLQIKRNSAFFCVKAGATDKEHNKAIRSFIYTGVTPEVLATLDNSIVDPDPKLDADKIYPEDNLQRLSPNYSYWMGRGISEDVLRKLEGGLAPEDEKSKLSGRFIFPIRDHITGRIVGFTGRLVDDNSFGPKHKHLVKTGRAVYPLWHNKEAILRAKKVVFVEGQGDLLAVMTAGIDYVINLLGLHFNSRMLNFIVSSGVDVIVSTNNDPPKTAPDGRIFHPGQDGAKKITDRIVPFLGESRVKVRLPQTRKDWCKSLEDKTGELEIFKMELEGKISNAPQETFSL